MGLLELRNGKMLPIRRVEMPAFAPEYERQGRVELEDGFTPQLHARIQKLRPRCSTRSMCAGCALNRCGLHERDLFPCRECLTGEYYLTTNEYVLLPWLPCSRFHARHLLQSPLLGPARPVG